MTDFLQGIITGISTGIGVGIANWLNEKHIKAKLDTLSTNVNYIKEVFKNVKK